MGITKMLSSAEELLYRELVTKVLDYTSLVSPLIYGQRFMAWEWPECCKSY